MRELARAMRAMRHDERERFAHLEALTSKPQNAENS
jgi:hypothetical protein